MILLLTDLCVELTNEPKEVFKEHLGRFEVLRFCNLGQRLTYMF